MHVDILDIEWAIRFHFGLRKRENTRFQMDVFDIIHTGEEEQTGIVRITVNPKYFRPTEVDLLIGNPKKAEEKLKWKRKITFKELVKEMVTADMELMRKDPTA
ncbi:unnamed protein product [Rotaria socialis]|uniref:GDP-mannose 4,6-dehydratase n=1 Tax=Rotaria socialis TaxID=392032 RepID=A0A817QVK9_9BILA|nr:unnamed protein product [Rotaria socialis]